MTPPGSQPTSWRGKAQFTATRWSIVLAAGGDRDGTDTRRALEELIASYWFPLYAFIRRQGHDAQTAEDLTQDFFTRLLEKADLADVDRAKGRFRSFLLAAAKHFLANEWDKRQALKRGGGKPVIALDALDAEARYALEPATDMTAERLFDRRWALAVLDQVLARLRQEYADAGKGKLYEAVKDCLAGGAGASSHADIAERLGMTEGAVKVAAHRLRRRYRDLLRAEIAQTVDSPGQVEEEITYLLNCL
jgi:RNA polymerase sigma-70 factor (ECF subfamily)